MNHGRMQDLSGLGYAYSEIIEKLVAVEATFAGAKATVAGYPAAAAKLGAQAIIDSTETELEDLRRKIERSWGWANTYNSEDDQIRKIDKRLKKLQQEIANSSGAEIPPDTGLPGIPGLPGAGGGKKDEIPWGPIGIVAALGVAVWLYNKNR